MTLFKQVTARYPKDAFAPAAAFWSIYARLAQGINVEDVDGEIDITDCVLLNKCLAGAVELNKTAKRNADVDQNNEIDTSDTIYLLQFLIRVIDTLPVSK